MKRLSLKLLVITVLFLTAGGCSVSGKQAATVRGPAAPSAVAFDTGGWKKFFPDSLLTGLIDSALGNNPDLVMAYRRMEIADASLRARRFALLPSLEGKVAAGQRRFGDYTMDGVGNYDTRFSPNITRDQVIPEHLPDYFAGLQYSWEIDIWKKLRHSKASALARYLQEAEARNWVVSNLVANIAGTYYELLALDSELKILEDFIRLQEDAELVIGYQKAAGQATELAVQQFRSQTLSSKNMYIETRQKIVEAENRLNVLLGRFPGPVKRNLDAFSDSLYTFADNIPHVFLHNRPDIRQAELQMKEAKLNTEVAKAALYPRLSFDGLLGYQSFNAGFLFSPASITYQVLASLATPVLNRAQLKTDVKIAGSTQQNALTNYQKAVLTAYAEVATETAHLHNLRRMYAYKKEEAEIAVAAVETANALFRTGRATYLEVILTQKNALLTNVQLVNLRERKLKAAISLYKALGGGWK